MWESVRRRESSPVRRRESPPVKKRNPIVGVRCGHVPYDAKMSANSSTSLRSLRSLRSSTSSTSPTSPKSSKSSTSSISPVIPPAEHKPSLHDLPLDVLRIIAGHYRELQRQDAASTLRTPPGRAAPPRADPLRAPAARVPDEHARRGAGAVLPGLPSAPAAAAVRGAASGGVLRAHYWDAHTSVEVAVDSEAQDGLKI